MSDKNRTIIGITVLVAFVTFAVSFLIIFCFNGFSLSNKAAKIGGNINFNGTVNAEICNASIKNGNNLIDTESKMQNFALLEAENSEKVESWRGLNFEFLKEKQKFHEITVSFEIKNAGLDKIYVSFNAIKGLGNNIDNIKIDFVGTNFILPMSSETYSIIFSVTEYKNSSLNNFDIYLDLTKELALLNGDISFSSENFNIDISGGILTGGKFNGDGTSKFGGINFEKSADTDFCDKLDSWKNASFSIEYEKFDKQPLTISFSVANNSEDQVELNFDIYKGNGINVDNILIDLLGATVIQPYQTESYVLTFACAEKIKTFLDSFLVNVNITTVPSVKTNGKINFFGTNINASISSGIIKEGSFVGDISNKMQSFELGSNLTDEQLNSKLLTWENVSFEFVKNENSFLPITISFNIANNSQEKFNLVTSFVKGSGENVENIVVEQTKIKQIMPFSKLNFTLSFIISNFEKSSLTGWVLNINLEKDYEAKLLNDDDTYQGMSFELIKDSSLSSADPNVKGKALISSFQDTREDKGFLTIPSYIQKEDEIYKVVGIKQATNALNSVFANNNDLVSVNLPYTFENIGDYAFYGCKNLETISLKKSIQSIGSYAFYNCQKLADAAIPDTVSYIGDYAFYSCQKLTNFVFPDIVSYIGAYAFYNCINLTEVSVSGFISSIKDYCFYNCYRITSVSLPDTVVSIGSYAFFRCSAISNLKMSKGVKEIKDNAFYYCAGLAEIELPNVLINIGVGAFESCYGLSTVILPLKVSNIGNNAFYNCKNLKSVSISANVKTIGLNAFTSCPKLETIIVDDNNKFFEDGNGNSIIEKSTRTLLAGCKTTVIAENVLIIGENAFYYSSELENITIPASIITIAKSAFSNCSSLSNVNFAPNSNLITIGYEAFRSCKLLQQINIPDSVTTIDISSFSFCEGIKSINIGKNVQDIGINAFYRCIQVETIVVSDKNEFYKDGGVNAIIQKADEKLLYGCKNTVIPETIKIIASTAFNSCTELVTIKIPASVEIVEDGAFPSNGCIKTVIIDNQMFASGFINKYAYSSMARHATTIYVKQGITIGAYVSSNFVLSEISDMAGYLKYIK